MQKITPPKIRQKITPKITISRTGVHNNSVKANHITINKIFGMSLSMLLAFNISRTEGLTTPN